MSEENEKKSEDSMGKDAAEALFKIPIRLHLR